MLDFELVVPLIQKPKTLSFFVEINPSLSSLKLNLLTVSLISRPLSEFR